MRKFFLTLPVFFALALVSCQQSKVIAVEKPVVEKPSTERPHPNRPINRDSYTQEQADACVRKKGRMSRGFAGFTCVIKTTDAGKSCTNSSQCQSHCLEKNGGGICAPETPFFGCFKLFENGLTPTLCRD